MKPFETGQVLSNCPRCGTLQSQFVLKAVACCNCGYSTQPLPPKTPKPLKIKPSVNTTAGHLL
jgi:uncharacterized Zn finger protein